MDLHLANRVSAEAKRSQQLSGMGGGVEQTADWSNVADRCRDNLKTIVFLTETKQTCPSASAIKVSDMFSGEGAPARAHDSIETPQTEAPHEQPHVPCLSSFVITLNQDVWLHLNKLVLLGQNQTPAEIILIFPSHLLSGTRSRFYTGSSAKNTTKITNSLII